MIVRIRSENDFAVNGSERAGGVAFIGVDVHGEREIVADAADHVPENLL